MKQRWKNIQLQCVKSWVTLFVTFCKRTIKKVRIQNIENNEKSEGAAREWSTVVIVIAIFIS